MIAAALLVLAAGTITTDEDGCRWIKPTAQSATPAAKPRPKAASPAASAPKVKKKRVPKPPVPGDELIGCDEDGPVFRSDLGPVEPESPEFFAPLPMVTVETFEQPVEPLIPPVHLECDCAEGSPVFGYPVFMGGGGGGGGGGYIVRPVAPVPEPSAWLLMLAGLLFVWRVRVRG